MDVSDKKAATVEIQETVTLDTDAANATIEEQGLTIKQALVTYRPAVLWSMAISLIVVMDGYDLAAIQGLIAYPAFNQRYGEWNEGLQRYIFTTKWQLIFGVASIMGSACGALASGFLTERMGIRRVILLGLAVMTGTIFITFFAPNIKVLIAGQALSGLPIGAFAPIGSAYISEVCPTVLRAYSLSFINACWVVGQLIAAGVLQGLVNNHTQWSYRIPFAIQWAWIPPIAILAYLAPESPWYLVRKGRLDEAKESLRRLTVLVDDEALARKVAALKHTNEFERTMQTEISYRDCFTKSNLPRTEIACFLLASQCFIGQAFAYNPTYFFIQAGVSADITYKLNFGASAIALVATFVSWFFMSRFGRRSLLITGYAAIAIDLLIIACLDFAPGAALWAQAALSIAWLGIYTAFIGPETFTVAAEISATRVRSQTLALARDFYHILSLVCSIAQTFMINPLNGNLKGKCGFVWFVTTSMVLLWAVFRLPESKDRTYEELDVLFAKKVKPWKFSSHQFNAVFEANAVTKELQQSEA